MADKPRIAHLTSVHTAFDKRIFHKEGKALARAGYEVVIAAPHEQNVDEDGVRICAVPVPKGRMQRITRTTQQVYRAALQENAALYHFHDPELIPVGVLLKLRGKRVVYDVHEDVPRQIADKTWIARPLRGLVGRIAGWLETSSARLFDGIVAATPPIARRFPAAKTVIAHNFAVLEEIAIPNPMPYLQREPLLIYLGYISTLRGANHMLEALALLPESLGGLLILAGLFSPPELEQEVRQMPGWARAEFRGWLPRDATVRLLSEARIGLSLFHPAPNYVECYPTKLFEYMAAGIPVIVSDFPLWRQIVGEAQCGLLVNPQDAQAIAGAMQWLLEHPAEAEAMGQRGRAAVEAKYHWGIEQQQLLRLYERLLD